MNADHSPTKGPVPTPTTLQQRRRRWRIGSAIAAISLMLLLQCVASSEQAAVDPFDGKDCILVAGHRVATGTRIVTWQELDGYSAYREGKHFDREGEPDGKKRYSRRQNLPDEFADKGELSFEDVQQVVDQFVVHYDVCGTSRQCFKVLHDLRNLSVHFLLDTDGTIYQTLDVADKAWHATIANNHGIGIEIAHPGAWPQPLNADMRRWYEQDTLGWRMKFPAWMKETGVRTEGFVPRPARPELVSGEVQGRTYHQFDFTEEQYSALAYLLAALHKTLPNLPLEAPRNSDGTVINRALPEQDLANFQGVVGHYHVQTNKQDPGPAFQWDVILARARELAAQ